MHFGNSTRDLKAAVLVSAILAALVLVVVAIALPIRLAPLSTGRTGASTPAHKLLV